MHITVLLGPTSPCPCHAIKSPSRQHNMFVKVFIVLHEDVELHSLVNFSHTLFFLHQSFTHYMVYFVVYLIPKSKLSLFEGWCKIPINYLQTLVQKISTHRGWFTRSACLQNGGPNRWVKFIWPRAFCKTTWVNLPFSNFKAGCFEVLIFLCVKSSLDFRIYTYYILKFI